MRLDSMMRREYWMTVLLLGAGVFAFAQQEEEQENRVRRATTIDSIDVVRDYRPILADAVKIRRSPDMTNKREYQPKLTYNILDKKLDITTGTKQLTLQEMPYTRPEDVLPNYVKIGAGNFNTLLGEVYLSTDQFADARLGAYVKHLGQRGSLEAQRYSQQQIGVFGRKTLPQVTLNGEVGYNRYATGFYGVIVDEGGVNLNPNPAKQAFNDIFLSGEVVSNYDPTRTDDMSYSAKLDGYAYSNAFQAKENSFAISGYLNRRINAFNVGANVSADFTTVSDEAYDIANHIARLNPYFRFKGDNYNVTLGANLVAEFGDRQRTNIFPSAEVDFALIPEYAHIFGGITGDINKTSFRELSKENPFLAPNIQIENSVDRMHIFGGIKGNAGATFGYKVHAFYRRVESLPLFVNSQSAPHQFGLIYDDLEESSTIVGLEGEVNLRVSETVSLGGKLNLNEYDLKNEEQAWFLPKMRVSANTRINISEKLYINGELLFNGLTYGKVYDAPLTTTPDEPGLFAQDLTGRRVSIPAFADIGAGAEYRVNNQIGIYIRANNLLGNDYERYLYYPRLGLNVIGGINFSF